jgi:hypothetical protein
MRTRRRGEGEKWIYHYLRRRDGAVDLCGILVKLAPANAYSCVNNAVRKQGIMMRPTCPVCAMEMAQERGSFVKFPGGKTEQILKYNCQACRVEMNTAAKNVSRIMEYRRRSAA